MPSSRRTVLGSIGGIVSGVLAGCSGSEPSTVDLGVSNVTSEERSLYIEVVPTGVETDLSESTIYAEWIEVGPYESDGAYVQRTAVFEEQRALVRVKANNGYIGEYTFIPDCPDDRTGEAVEVRLVSRNQVQFSQNWCR